jgi:acetylornithine deacetylase/succinyl-diaminopimelate desuccinylase-like protein
MALTCGEEGGGQVNGASLLARNRRDLIDAASPSTRAAGRRWTPPASRSPQPCSREKYPVSFTLEVTNPGGHSSRPVPDNAIYALARALDAPSQLRVPGPVQRRQPRLLRADVQGGRRRDRRGHGRHRRQSGRTPEADALLSKNASYHAYLRTTCVATMLEAGHAANALPQRAAPRSTAASSRGADRRGAGRDREGHRRPAVKVTAGQRVMVAAVPAAPDAARCWADREGHQRDVARRAGRAGAWRPAPPTPPAERGRHPGLRRLGIFTSPTWANIHGLNERVRRQVADEGREFTYRLVKLYAEQKD